jgi:hypothetical protein
MLSVDAGINASATDNQIAVVVVVIVVSRVEIVRLPTIRTVIHPVIWQMKMKIHDLEYFTTLQTMFRRRCVE